MKFLTTLYIYNLAFQHMDLVHVLKIVHILHVTPTCHQYYCNSSLYNLLIIFIALFVMEHRQKKKKKKTPS